MFQKTREVNVYEKNFVALILSLVMITSLCSIASASSGKMVQKNSPRQEAHNREVDLWKAEIQQTLSDLSIARMKRESRESFNKLQSATSISELEVQLEEKLRALGVNETSSQELQSFVLSSDMVSPMVSVPTSNSKVKWFDITYNYYSSGTMYELQDLYAQAVGVGTNLAVHGESKPIYTNKQVTMDNLNQIAQIYKEKMISNAITALNPWFELLPYELGFSSNNNITNNEHRVEYISEATICFTYVTGALGQTLSFVSNFVEIQSFQIFKGFRNGNSYLVNTNVRYDTHTADHFASPSKAIASFNNTNNPSRWPFASAVIFYNHDRTAQHKVNFARPLFPSQVTN